MLNSMLKNNLDIIYDKYFLTKKIGEGQPVPMMPGNISDLDSNEQEIVNNILNSATQGDFEDSEYGHKLKALKTLTILN